MTRRRFPKLGLSFIALSAVILSCSKSGTSSNGSGGTSTDGGSGGDMMGGSGSSATASGGETGDGGVQTEGPTPKYYPVPGFEDCIHAEVKADCEHGWCKLPPSCFVMGSPEDEWERGLNTETQTAVILTQTIEVQQMELTRGEWSTITGLVASGPDSCVEATCPVAMVSWWDAAQVADLMSEKKGLDACYSLTGCTGSLGVDLQCDGVSDPEKSIYECKGYRLPTRAEVEYAARAGTWSTWYSGDITEQADNDCHEDSALDKIAWYCSNSGMIAHPSGEKLANHFGLHDLIGNIYEWTNGDSRSTLGGVSESRRSDTFGGLFKNQSYLMRSANRLSLNVDLRFHELGFRLYRTLFEDSERSNVIVEP